MKEADKVDDEGEREEEAGMSELSSSGTRSRSSTLATTVSNDTVSITSDDGGIDWAYSRSLQLRALEELRWSFRSELEEPSAWTLQRIAVLTNARNVFGPRARVRIWYDMVASATGTPAGAPLRLPEVALPKMFAIYKPMTWEEASRLSGEDWELCFGRAVDEASKRQAKMSIDFLIPGARSMGLSPDERKMLFTAASMILSVNGLKAQGLLWVMAEKYRHNLLRTAPRRMNSYSEEFMAYAMLFPPPITLTL